MATRGHDGRDRRRLPRTIVRAERLEPRHCLAAASVAPTATVSDPWGPVGPDQPSPTVLQIVWQGSAVDVVADAWIVGAEPAMPIGELSMPAAWRMESLGEGLHSLWAPGSGVDDVLGWAAATPAIAFVEPDFFVTPSLVPRDPAFERLWGLAAAGTDEGAGNAGINAPAAWDVTTGSRDVVVAVIDTGVDIRHPDLTANIWRNPGEIPGDGVDNDGNGFVDDMHGWDFVRRSGIMRDENGHGTHVAGTIGAVGDNGVGGTGVAWQVSIMPLRFLDRSGSGTTSAAVAAINYATRMRRDHGINVVATNNSWGGAGASASLRRAIEAGARTGILFVAAAGNEGEDNDRRPTYPASYESEAVIAVAATDRSGRLAGFSNVGETSVDIAAPGVAILSTAPGGRSASFSGTSMAAPHVTGVIALAAAANPAATAGQLREALLTTARPIAELAGRVASGGIVDAAAAVRAIVDAEFLPPGETNDSLNDPVEPEPAEPEPAAPPVDEFGDVRRTAHTIQERSGAVTLRGMIGDGPFGNRDVDLFRVRLAAGQRLVVDVAARSLPGGSRLDSVARIFSHNGRRLAVNDDRPDSLDSYLVFTAPKAGVYFVGLSGFGNTTYGIKRLAQRNRGSTGIYEATFRFGAPPAPRMEPQVFGFPDSLAAFAAFGAGSPGPVDGHGSPVAAKRPPR